MRRNEYDPGSPYDPPPRRRMGDEYDDAWAGGDDADTFDDAAGYSWEAPRRAPLDDDDADLAPGGLPRRHYRSRRMARFNQDERSRAPRSYTDDPSYYRDRAHAGEYGEYYEKPKRADQVRLGARSTGLQLPFWQVLLLVIMGLVALLAAGLACMSIFLVL